MDIVTRGRLAEMFFFVDLRVLGEKNVMGNGGGVLGRDMGVLEVFQGEKGKRK